MYCATHTKPHAGRDHLFCQAMSVKKTLQLITFDATGTLLKFRKPPTKLYSEFASKHGLTVDEAKLQKAFKAQWVKLNQSQPHFGKCWSSWWVEFVTGTYSESLIQRPKKKSDLEPLALKLIDHFKTPECWEVTSGTKTLLKKLKTDNIKLGIISNFDPRLRGLLSLFELHDYFDVIALSHELQLSKPDKRIFDFALRNCHPNIKSSESTVLHVGNDAEKDYVGARNAGWSAALINPDSKNKCPSIPQEDCFSSIEDLDKFLYST